MTEGVKKNPKKEDLKREDKVQCNEKLRGKRRRWKVQYKIFCKVNVMKNVTFDILVKPDRVFGTKRRSDLFFNPMPCLIYSRRQRPCRFISVQKNLKYLYR